MPDTEIGTIARWLPDYAIGVEVVDAEHRGLFRMAEKLHRGIRSGRGREIVGPLLDELFDYTCYHFEHEEQLMEQIAYPHYPTHCQQHRELRSQILVMKEGFAAGESDMAIEMLRFVTDWLKCHTTTSDRRIGTYMRKCGMVT
jgi:hemerythrin-like metal-binding protein